MPLSRKREARRVRAAYAAKKAEKEAQEKAAGKAEEERKEARARITRAYREKGLADGSEPDRVKVFPMETKGMVGYMKHIEAKGKTLQYVDWVTGELLEVPGGDWGYRMAGSEMQRRLTALELQLAMHEAEHVLREVGEWDEIKET